MDNWKNKYKDGSYGMASEKERMADHTTFAIGGPVDLMLTPESEEEIARALLSAREDRIPLMILGNGSNLLVRDGGIRGIVVKIAENFSEIRVNENRITARAGALLSKISEVALANGLTGFEFAGGIPGTVGGAMVMNAGAYGGEMKDVVESVKVIDRDGNTRILSCDDMGFAYRHSRVIPMGWTVLSATFLLEPGDPEEISAKIADYTHQRETKQPLEYPSAGSTFKRPAGYFAGKLIDDSGLRGFRYKDAQVSEKHCGFVVNRGKASCSDVLTLIESVQKIVKELQGVELETEVKILGENL